MLVKKNIFFLFRSFGFVINKGNQNICFISDIAGEDKVLVLSFNQHEIQPNLTFFLVLFRGKLKRQIFCYLPPWFSSSSASFTNSHSARPNKKFISCIKKTKNKKHCKNQQQDVR